MLTGRLNIYWNSNKNEQIKMMKWITCETEESFGKLEEMFMPTASEIKNFEQMNESAK